MPATTPSQHDGESREASRRRPSSQQQPSEHSSRTRSTKKTSTAIHAANRVKSKPANPAVISSIISSLETLEPPRSFSSQHNYSTDSLRLSRTQSRDGSFASAPSVPFSSVSASKTSGFGVEYGVRDDFSDEQSDSDAALPPIIPTTRSPSGLSQFNAVRSPSYIGDRASPLLRPASVNTRNSSYSEQSRDVVSGTNNKNLSADNWVRQNSRSRESLHEKQSAKSLRRATSYEPLRSGRTEKEEALARAFEVLGDSRAEGIIRKVASQTTSSKGRLFLNDDSAIEEQSSSSDAHSSRAAGFDFGSGFGSPAASTRSPLQKSSQSSQEALSSLQPSPRPSPRPSPIADSIPMRTSSLHQPSSSPGKKKKSSKKLKHHTISGSPSKSGVTEEIPDTKWADLGEEDETVRRIMELRKLRETRLQESNSQSTPNDMLSTARADANAGENINNPADDPGLSRVSARRSGSASDATRSNNITEPNTKARKLLGIADHGTRDSHHILTPASASADDRRQPAHSQPAHISPERRRRRPASADTRPVTARSAASLDPPLFSLDYSYVHAVDALQGDIESREQRGDKPRSIVANPADPNSPSKVGRHKRADSHPESISSSTLTTVPSPGSRGKRKPSLQHRWTTATAHPDVPLDFDKRRSRRKSMSDARNTRIIEEEQLDFVRRDSIEDGVQEYLDAPRLSLKVRHPVTGRVISFSDVGDPNGAAVLVCVGMGLTRYVSAFYDELATTLRLRLITIERPGVGGSEPFPSHDRSGPLNWPDDVLAVCEKLHINQFSILAHSAGAVYALATALVLPQFVKGKVHLLAPWIPPSQLQAVAYPAASSSPSHALPRSQRFLRVLPTPFLKAANSSFMNAASVSLKPVNKRKTGPTSPVQERANSESPVRSRPKKSMNEKPDFQRRESLMHMDQFMPATNPMENFPIAIREEEDDDLKSRRASRASLYLSATAGPLDPYAAFASNALNAAEHAERERQVEYGSRLTQRTWEYAIRDSNPATDLLVCLERSRDVGFRYTDVTRPVIITHGSEDKRVPVGNVKWLADQMNSAALQHRHPQTRDTFHSDMVEIGGCDVRVLYGEGHGLMANPVIMSDVLTEISTYWRDAM